jgi:hypothetical protein
MPIGVYLPVYTMHAYAYGLIEWWPGGCSRVGRNALEGGGPSSSSSSREGTEVRSTASKSQPVHFSCP